MNGRERGWTGMRGDELGFHPTPPPDPIPRMGAFTVFASKPEGCIGRESVTTPLRVREGSPFCPAILMMGWWREDTSNLQNYVPFVSS